MYLYQTIIYKDVNKVIGADPNNDANKADFVNNYKSIAQKIDSIIVAETSFEIDMLYADFKAKIISPITWADVKYIEDNNSYTLYLASENPL